MHYILWELVSIMVSQNNSLDNHNFEDSLSLTIKHKTSRWKVIQLNCITVINILTLMVIKYCFMQHNDKVV